MLEDRAPVFAPRLPDIAVNGKGSIAPTVSQAFKYQNRMRICLHRVGNYKGLERSVFLNEPDSTGNLKVVPVHPFINLVIANHFRVLAGDFLRFVGWSLAHFIHDAAVAFHLGNFHLNNGYVHIRAALRVREGPLFVGDLRAVGHEFLDQALTGRCVRIAQGLCVQDAGDFAAMALELQRLEQVFRAMVKRGIHQNQVIALLGLKREKIVMDNPKTLPFKNGPQRGIDLYAIDIRTRYGLLAGTFIVRRITHSLLIHPVTRLSGKIALPRAGFQYALNSLPVVPSGQFFREGFRRGIKRTLRASRFCRS